MPCLVQINGGSVEEKVDFAYNLFEQKVSVDSVFQPNEMLDTIAITKGKGTEGVVTRWGVTRLPRKTHRGLRKVSPHLPSCNAAKETLAGSSFASVAALLHVQRLCSCINSVFHASVAGHCLSVMHVATVVFNVHTVTPAFTHPGLHAMQEPCSRRLMQQCVIGGLYWCLASSPCLLDCGSLWTDGLPSQNRDEQEGVPGGQEE